MAIKTSTTMSLEHYHDFYFVEALKAEIRTRVSANEELGFNGAVQKLLEDIDAFEEKVFPNMALRTFMYIYAACLGEARHACSNSAKTLFIRETANTGRLTLFGSATEYPPTKKNINAIVTIFSQEWHSGFGGSAWRQIAEALNLYFKLPPAAFIDHVVDLQHNNGTVFSKSDAKNTIFFDVIYPYGRFGEFLDYKFSKNILKDYGVGCMKLTRRVYTFIQRYRNIFDIKAPMNWIKVGLEPLSSYNIAWGNSELTTEEKWADWWNVSVSNEPTARTLLSVCGLEDIYVSSCTEEKIIKHAKLTKKEVKKAAGKYWLGLKKQVEARLNNWLSESLKHCKKQKLPITYDCIPCKARSIGGAIKLCFPIEGQGIGTKTEYGFTLEIPIIYGIYGSNETNYVDDGQKYTDGYVRLSSGEACLYIESTYYFLGGTELEKILND